MNRHKLRERIFQTIFQYSFMGETELESYIEDEEVPEIEVEEGEEISEEDREYINKKAYDILAHLSEIDEMILSHSKGRRIQRIGLGELAILRLAVYEIKFDEDIPEKVAINEAVELSKTFCNENSSKYINGVLAGIVNEEK